MYLVVGLGNPGAEFAGTRHNIGWEVLDALAGRFGWTRGSSEEFGRLARAKFDSLTLDGGVTVGGRSEKLMLLKPLTYMNLSGRAVQAAMAFYQLTASQILIVLDDMALPVGMIRMRSGGSSGGHNGLKDIERALATNQYPRLRLGIDPPPVRLPGKDYVLGRFSPEQRPWMDNAVKKAADAAICWMENGIETAMNRFNSKEEKE